MTKHIVPQYKLILFYDIAAEDTETYFQFVMSDMVPALQDMGLYLFRAFHTIPGPNGENFRLRQIEYVTEDLDTMRSVLNGDRWHDLEGRLQDYVTNYTRKVVRFRSGFQL